MVYRLLCLLPVCLIPFLLAVTLWSLIKNDSFRIQSVEWSIQPHSSLPEFIWNELSQQKLKQSEQHFISLNLWLLDESIIGRVFDEFEWVCNWRARKQWPLTLFIEVELCAISLWEKQGKQIRPFYANKKWGRWYSLSAQENFPFTFEFPVVWGEEQKLVFAQRFLSFIHTGNISWLPKMQYAKVAPDGSIAWQLNKGAVTLLTRGDIDLNQWERVTRVLEFIEKKQIGARVIDATVTKKILVRLRGGP